MLTPRYTASILKRLHIPQTYQVSVTGTYRETKHNHSNQTNKIDQPHWTAPTTSRDRAGAWRRRASDSCRSFWLWIRRAQLCCNSPEATVPGDPPIHYCRFLVVSRPHADSVLLVEAMALANTQFIWRKESRNTCGSSSVFPTCICTPIFYRDWVLRYASTSYLVQKFRLLKCSASWQLLLKNLSYYLVQMKKQIAWRNSDYRHSARRASNAR
jgi:hypothetical protein